MKAGAVARRSWWVSAICLAGSLTLSGCEAFPDVAAAATIDANLTIYAVESESIRVAATAERIAVVDTVVAAGTRIAQVSAANAALGATLRANQTGTPAVQAVVVSAEDMGGSLEGDMISETLRQSPAEAAMRVTNLSTAASTDPDSGCSSGTVTRFSPKAELIYVTARVTALQTGTRFEVEWQSGGRSLASASWRADYSKSFECVWFYATPSDFQFLPGAYLATMFVNGETLGATEFEIVNNN